MTIFVFVAAGCSKNQNQPKPVSQAKIQSIYQANCASCHGKHGEGTGAGISLANAQNLSSSEVETIIRQGRGNMPAWQGRLSDAEIKGLVQYVHQLPSH
jgi:mono/diheme cytochrome c family protein